MGLLGTRLETGRRSGSIADGVLMDQAGLNPEDWVVLLVLRGAREQQPTLEDLLPNSPPFGSPRRPPNQQPLGRHDMERKGTVAALRDIEGRKMANDSFMNSARAAGISGSGPALVIVVPSQQGPTLERIKSWYGMRYPEAELLETAFLSHSER